MIRVRIVPDGEISGNALFESARTSRDDARKLGLDAIILQTELGAISVVTSLPFDQKIITPVLHG